MPELPEVETVRRGLEPIIEKCHIQFVKMGSKKLRVNPKPSAIKRVVGQRISAVKRVAKYLLIELDEDYLMSHLGMTGSWRVETDRRKHDHVRIGLEDGRVLTYNDPRRFGMFDVIKKSEIKLNKKFSSLGFDPVQDSGFTTEAIYDLSRGCQSPVKVFIMNQNFIVGVGNIYASEALYLAGIHPLRKASSLNFTEVKTLVKAIGIVLHEAIFWGGTTISDFKQAGGSSGYFQNMLLAYGRDKEPCVVCGTAILSQMIVGRNSYWCPQCQTF